MLHRAAAAASVVIVLAGALVAPAAGAPESRSSAASLSHGSAPVQSVGTPDDARPAPPRDDAGTDLRALPAADGSALGNGALSTLVDSVADGTGVPDELAAQVTLDGERIRVEVTHTDESAARAAVADASGTDVVVITGTLLAASMPAETIADLQASPSIVSVSLPAFAAAPPEAGRVAPATVGSKGGDVYAKTKIAQWHSIGLTGSGVAVGIVDYFSRAAWSDARTKGEIPAASGTFCRWGGSSCSVYDSPSPDVHGVAVAEAIHDMAPGASLYLATVATNEDLKKAIDYFASQKVKVISRSLGGNYDGPGNGTGPSAALVDYAVSKGMTWFNSAGNSGAYMERYADGSSEWVGGYWRQQWRDTDGDGWMEFEIAERDADGVPTGAVTYSETMYVWCSPYFRLRWNDWGSGARTDYDIYRISNTGFTKVRPGYKPNDQSQSGIPPMELQNGSEEYFRCNDVPTLGGWIRVGIQRASEGNGSDGDVLELAGNSGDIALTASSPGSAGEAFVDSKNPGLAAVGAVDPVDGPDIAGYSSQGPTNDGRIKPEISAGSNFTSRAYTYAGYGGRFNGTSAATPVVAGAAAVVLQRHGLLTPAQLVALLTTTHTTDRGAAGVDTVFGSGELIMTPIAVAAFSSTTAPKITGSRTVGSTLQADKPAWRPAASFTYRWYRNGTPIWGAKTSTYRLTAADGGTRISVAITGTRGGYATVRAFSSETSTIPKVFTKGPTPKITGTVKVGRILGVTVGTWSPAPTTLSYQWKVNGASVRGATKKSFTLRKSDAGKRITVTVKAARSGYTTISKTSARTAPVAR